MSKKLNRYELKYDMFFINIISFLYTVIVCMLISFIFNNESLSSRFSDLPFSVSSFEASLFYLFFFLFIFVVWAILHEVIHGVSYILLGASRKNISFGVVLEKGIFFCKCGENISKKNIMISVIAPFLLIGVVTGIISLFLGSYLLFFLSMFNIIGASGDLTMFFFFIRRNKDLKFREIGDSTTFILTTSEELNSKKFLGIKSVRLLKDDEYKEKESDKLINVTKFSKVFILIYLFMLLVSLFIMFIS